MNILIAIIIFMFLVGMMGVFEMRRLNVDNEQLRQAARHRNKTIETLRATINNYEKEPA